ncbi:MAG: winged helix DNA-binding domain-containing protein [Phenylobacterium sp.]|uniref:winged helix DNA-binding domain-containing protein n=1 Tax=Phenylobacterium sp. TaxID=1871053 RepID=UPI0027208B94|nr:winged helix DNA-binding domain-containing protein [Phenylobacterium sp.]MDO8912434.1 winged helix DNA-binding domain-containing protein [Phenylobacterium sp.]MDP3099815.1 winged helix DNA-binding domain-containing protein [Phenylobacterium sp.]
MADDVLTARDLNRALLARQMLLERQAIAPADALSRLLAIQAQLPRTPFIGLWSRLAGFEPDDLRTAIASRKVVRATAMRGTLHLVTAADFLTFRGSLRTGEAITLPGGTKTTVTELEPVLALARKHFAEPREFESFRDVLEKAGYSDIRIMAYAARHLLPLVQAASDTPYGFSPGGEFVLAKAYLGEGIAAAAEPAELLRRYLAAWGPATPADFSGWSGLKGVAALFEALGDDLVTFRDDRGKVLYDLKDAPRPGGHVPAPPRFVPDFDAVTQGHQDRARILPPEHAPRVASKNLQVPPMLLVDGFVAGTWKLEAKKKTATVSVTAFEKFTAKDHEAIEAEAIALAKTFEPTAEAAVLFA